MRKKITVFKSLLTVMLLFGSMMVSAQVSEIWNKTATEFDWMGNYNARGIDYSSVTDHLYVAAGNWDAAGLAVKVLDPISGEVIKDLATNVTITDPGYGFHDVEVDDAGGIFAIMTTTNKWNPINIVYWENEDATPVVLFEMTGNNSDFGPGFSVNGDFKNGKSLIIIPLYQETNVGYIESENGVLGTYEILPLTGISAGKNVSIDALGNRIVDGFWYDNSVTADASLIDGSGNVYDALDNAGFLSTGDQAGVKQFSTGGKDYLTVGSQGNIYLVDITGVTDFSDVTLANLVQDTIKGTDPQPEWSTPAGYGQEEAIKVFPSGGYQIFSLSAARYIKSLATEEAPYATDLLMTGFAMPGEQTQVSYTYNDINGDLEGATEFEWFIDDGAKGKTSVGTGATYDVQLADVGKDLTFTVLPKALTGTTDGDVVESTPVTVSLSSTAPEAKDIAMTGTPEVYSLLTGSYTYYDLEMDAEGESMIKWWRADDAAGLNAVEIAADTLKYAPQPADEDKYIIFSVIPVAQVEPTTGDSVAVASAMVVFPVFLPVASNVTIDTSAHVEVSRILSGSYSYSDLNEDLEGESVLAWYRADSKTAAKNLIADSDTNRYELVTADLGKYIFFGVKPVTVDDEEGVEVFDTTDVVRAKPEESAPVASDVMANGTPEVGAVMSGSYTYFDYTGDLEGNSIYKWYTADDAAGANATLIADADDQTLLVTDTQVGKFFIFEVTPVAVTGGLLVGEPVSSSATTVAAVVSSHEVGIERMWIASTKTGAAPFYLNPAVTTERGFAIGTDHIYIASRYNGTKVVMVNKEDGSYAGELNTEGIEGGVYAINDVEVSDDGQILAAPLAFGTEFWIFKWDNELAAPVKWLSADNLPDGRYGDKFSVTGDLSSGTAIILAVCQNTDKVVRWVITNGVAAEADVITLEKELTNVSSPAAVPFTASVDANILVDGKGMAPTIFDKDGVEVGTIAMIDDYGAYKIQSNSPNVFNYKGRTMAAFFQAMRKEPLGARIIVADITSEPYQIVDSTEYISNSMSWDGYLGEVDITVDEEYYHAYMLQAKNAVARYRGKLELPEFVSAITSFVGDELHTDFTKNIDFETVSPTILNWTIKADDTAVEVDSIYSVDATITFVLTTAIAEDQVVTVEYDGKGGVAAFDGMPLSAFGPESVLNIVGADVPVASNVTITGTVETGQEVTGTYTFNDPDGDLEGDSEYQWYYATDADGTDKLKVIGGTSIAYTIADDMKDKYIAFEVIPVSITGGDDYLVGEAAMSSFMLVGSVGVDDNFATLISMYPNPVNDILTISNCTNVNTIKVFDYTGRVIMTLHNSGNSELTIDMNSLNSGVFMIQLENDKGQTKVKRIVKN